MILGQLIKAYRKDNAVSLRKLALEIGMDYTVLSRFENGETTGLTIDNFHKILLWVFSRRK